MTCCGVRNRVSQAEELAADGRSAMAANATQPAALADIPCWVCKNKLRTYWPPATVAL